MVFGFGKLSDSFINWALSEEKFDTIAMKSVDEGGLYFKKGGDSMAHIMKGTIALFISCGENIFGEYITIEQPKNIVIEEVGVEELKKKDDASKAMMPKGLETSEQRSERPIVKPIKQTPSGGSRKKYRKSNQKYKKKRTRKRALKKTH